MIPVMITSPMHSASLYSGYFPLPASPAFYTGEPRPGGKPANRILPNRVIPQAHYLPPYSAFPRIHPTATVRRSTILGDVIIGPGVHVVNATLRADEGTPFYIGPYSNIQDNAVLHGYYTFEQGLPVRKNLLSIPGKGLFSIYIGSHVSLAHSVTLHGPVFVGDHTFVGFNTTLDRANLGKNVEIGAHAYIAGVTIPDNTAIRPGAVITKPEDIPRHVVPLKGVNTKIARINSELALAYHSPIHQTANPMNYPSH